MPHRNESIPNSVYRRKMNGICRVILKQHIHRLPVVKARRLVGIITTFDIVRCVGGQA